MPEEISRIAAVGLLMVGVLFLAAPIGCWMALNRLIRVQRDILLQLKTLNGQVANRPWKPG